MVTMSPGRICAKEYILVVPTIRENCFRDFIGRWNEVGLFDHCDLIIMEDNPERTFDAESLFPSDGNTPNWIIRRGGLIHYSWSDIERVLGDDSWIIPRRSDTVRSFGYLMAYSDRCPFILTLDDDCYPDPNAGYADAKGFLDLHRQALEKSRWMNTLNSVKPRGVPFYNLGHNDRIMVNHGLWTNVLDYDAPTQLAAPIPEKFSFDNRIVPANSYFPMCGMNVMWKREATVLMYHLLMGREICAQKDARMQNALGVYEPITNKLPFDRFGDIWAGIIMKKILDRYEYNVSTGTPYIRHERASNPFTNLKKEANGIEVNENFWEYVDSFSTDSGTLEEAYLEMGSHIIKFTQFPEYNSYFEKLGIAMQTWAKIFMGFEGQ